MVMGKNERGSVLRDGKSRVSRVGAATLSALAFVVGHLIVEVPIDWVLIVRLSAYQLPPGRAANARDDWAVYIRSVHAECGLGILEFGLLLFILLPLKKSSTYEKAIKWGLMLGGMFCVSKWICQFIYPPLAYSEGLSTLISLLLCFIASLILIFC